MDFSTLKGLTIPEGAVTQIADAVGNVLWSAAEGTALVIITSKCQGIMGETASITIKSAEPFPNPSNPSTAVTEWTAFAWEEPNCTIELPTGSTIECMVDDTKQSERCYVSLNGTNVLTVPGTYTYTVTRDVTINMTDKYEMGEYGMITIAESAEKLESFTVNDRKFAFRSGQTWGDWLVSEFNDGYLAGDGYRVYVSSTYGTDEENGYDYADVLYDPNGGMVSLYAVIQSVTYNAWSTTI